MWPPPKICNPGTPMGINLLSVFILVQRIFNYFLNYSTHRLYFGEVETRYRNKNGWPDERLLLEARKAEKVHKHEQRLPHLAQVIHVFVAEVKTVSEAADYFDY